ncbi:MAG: Fic family protein [Bacillota bacterium]|nr:Fic family protein [Bacillota bacterium]
MNQLLLEVNKIQFQLDLLFNSFSDDQKKMIEQTFLLDEIQSTNKTENIFSTRSDIFEVLKDVTSVHNRKIVSIINSYRYLEKNKYEDFTSLHSIRNLYDLLMENAYESAKDIPDGEIFRKGSVHISDGFKSIQDGFYPENMIQKGMEEYLLFNQKEDIDIYLKLILTHFMIETIHPFYDGNGRFGRYLMSLELSKTRNTIFSYFLSTSINKNKKKYYNALKNARDIHEFGCLNSYVKLMLEIFLDGIQCIFLDLQGKKKRIEQNDPKELLLSKSELKIYNCIREASILTYFGICNQEILEITGVSKRTLMSTLKKLREQNLMLEVKFGKAQYHKIQMEGMLVDA